MLQEIIKMNPIVHFFFSKNVTEEKSTLSLAMKCIYANDARAEFNRLKLLRIAFRKQESNMMISMSTVSRLESLCGPLLYLLLPWSRIWKEPQSI